MGSLYMRYAYAVTKAYMNGEVISEMRYVVDERGKPPKNEVVSKKELSPQVTWVKSTLIGTQLCIELDGELYEWVKYE